MIDRGKETDEKQTDGDFELSSREAGQDRSHAYANKKYRHHPGAAPPVAKPARRYGAGGESDEAGNRKRQQLTVRLFELPFQG